MRRYLQNQLLSPAHRIIAAKTRSLWLELPYWASNEGNFRGAGPSKSSTRGFFFSPLCFSPQRTGKDGGSPRRPHFSFALEKVPVSAAPKSF